MKLGIASASPFSEDQFVNQQYLTIFDDIRGAVLE
jgi:hypothetical protein